MSDKNAILLKYLMVNSELAKTLGEEGEPVSLEELLCCQTDFCKCVSLLRRLLYFHKDRLKLSNCLLDSELPYDSLTKLSNKNLMQLRELCNYLILPDSLCKKLDVIIENGIDINKYDIYFDITNTAHWAKIGDLRGLQWAHKQGYPWYATTCIYASQNGYLDCLRYAHEQGCPWNAKVAAVAVQNGHLDCLEYARANGCSEN